MSTQPRQITERERVAELEREVRVYRAGLLDVIHITQRAGMATVPQKVRQRASEALNDGPRA